MDGLVIGVLGAKPQDEGWEEVCTEASAALESARGDLFVLPGDESHRRGVFPAFTVGISHGGGKMVSFCDLICQLTNLCGYRSQATVGAPTPMPKFLRA